MKELKLKSSADGLELAVALFEPAGPSKGIVQISHGMCEHKERYYDFLNWLCDKGYICVIHDHRGHGASVKDSNDLGYMYDGGWQALVEDIRTVGDWVRGQHPGLPFTLFGHSMGSLAARSYAKRYDSSLDCLIVCGCPSDNPAKGAGQFLARLYGTFKGWHYRPALLQKMSFGSFNKPFENEGYASAWVCSDKQTLDAYHSDPLCQYVFTANGFYNLLGLMKDCYSSKGWAMGKPSLPVHFISGAEDPCRTSDKALAGAVEAMRAHGYTRTDLKTYPGMRHEILNETDRLSVYEDVLAMLA